MLADVLLFKLISISVMGLTEEYQDKVQGITDSMDSRLKEQDALSIKSSLDDVLPGILLVLGFVILFNFFIPVGQKVQVYITWLNYLVIAYFSVRLLVEYRLSSSKNQFLHEHVFDFVMVVPAVSILQEVRFLKVVDEAAQEYQLFDAAPEILTGATLQTTGIAARLGKIFKIIKRSIGL